LSSVLAETPARQEDEGGAKNKTNNHEVSMSDIPIKVKRGR